MTSISKRLRSRTYWLAILVAASSQLPLVKDLLADYYGLTALVLSIMIAALREVTTESLDEK